MKISLSIFASLAGACAFAANMSSREVECFMDNGETPSVRVVPSGSSVEVFAPGGGELYVDGVLAARSADGADISHLLGCPADAARSCELMLVSGGESSTKFVTMVPSASFSCLLHALSTSGRMLDSRPAGTIRRIKKDGRADVAYSGRWNPAATGASVSLYAGSSAAGEPLSVLAETAGDVEGYCVFLPKSLASGVYTLEHFDGVESLTAQFAVGDGGFLMVVK